MFEEYYKILGVRPGSSKESVKRAFRRKALQLHPDRNPGKDTSSAFLKVVEAYDVLYNGLLPKSKRNESAEQTRQREQAEKAEKIRVAKEKAREAMKERREIERAFYRRLVNGYLMKYAYFQAFVFMLFAVLTAFNYFMPYVKHESYIQSKNILYYYHLNEERAFLNICGSSYRASMKDFFAVKRGDPVTLELSFMFKDVMKVEFMKEDGESSYVTPHESLYMFFPLVPLLMLVPFINLLYKEPSVRFYVLFFMNVFVGSAILLYLMLDGGRVFRIFQGFSC